MKNAIKIIVIAIPGIIALLFILSYLITNKSWCYSFDAGTGAIGDTIGGIFGPIIALIGAILTFFAFYIQFEMNQIQQGQISNQEKLLNQQHFENTFYRFLDYYNRLTENLVFNSSGGQHTGRYYFKDLYLKELNEEKLKETFPLKEEELNLFESIQNFYAKIYIKFEGDLMPWFNSVENILLNIERDKYLDDKIKNEYAAILRSQLSSYEMVVIAIHINTRVLEHRRLAELVKKYKVIRTDIWALNDSEFYNQFILQRMGDFLFDEFAERQK